MKFGKIKKGFTSLLVILMMSSVVAMAASESLNGGGATWYGGEDNVGVALAESNDDMITTDGHQISRETVESIFSDSTSNKKTLSFEDDTFTEMLDLLTRKQLDYYLENDDKEILASEIKQLENRLEELGGVKLTQEQVDLIFNGDGKQQTSKPYVPPNTSKYDFWSVERVAYGHNTFLIYASPNSFAFGNMLVVENKTLQQISSKTIGGDIADNTWIKIYGQKAIGSAFSKMLKYGSLIPFELFWPDGNYSSDSTKLEVFYSMETTLNWIYVAYPGTEAYDQIISTAKVTGDYNFITKYIGKKSDIEQIPFTYTQNYYGDYYKAASMYQNGEWYNHYYPITSIKLIDKDTGKTVLSTAIRTLSSIVELN